MMFVKRLQDNDTLIFLCCQLDLVFSKKHFRLSHKTFQTFQAY